VRVGGEDGRHLFINIFKGNSCSEQEEDENGTARREKSEGRTPVMTNSITKA